MRLKEFIKLGGKKIRVRAAPSPTGEPHVGNIRTALFNYLFAVSKGGHFIIRVEDTDRKRVVSGSTEIFLEALKWLGIKWSKKLYRQSERLEIYNEYVSELLHLKHAYYCFCTPERLTRLRNEQQKAGLITKYDGNCRKTLNQEKINELLKKETPFVIRMAVPQDETIVFKDFLRGDISIKSEEIEDQILVKSDGFPTYHLANVVDDHLMEITHVIRAEEWLPSTAKHVLLYQFLKWKLPIFVHVPLVVNKKRQKLSKREGAFSVLELKKEGCLPEAVINYLAFLGWHLPSDDREIYSPKEIISLFKLEDLHKSPAVFDPDRLDWFNAQHIRKLSIDELTKRIIPYLKSCKKDIPDKSFIKRLIEVEQPRLVKLADIKEMARPFLGEGSSYTKELLVWKKMPLNAVKKNLEALYTFLTSLPSNDWVIERLEEKIKNYINKNRLVTGEVLWPLRVALTGQEKSPSPFECAYILGKEKTLRRLKQAIEKL